MSSSVTVRVLGDASNFNKTIKGVESSGNKLKGTFLKMGAAIGGAFAVDKALDFAGDAVQAAMEDEKAQATLAKTLSNVTGARKDDIAAVEEWIGKTALAVGVADDELRPALGSLVTAVGDTTEAQELLTQALDISAATGKPVEAVAKDLAKAHNGSTSALKKYGIQVKDATGKAISFEDAQAKLNKAFGGAAQTAANTTSGKMARLKVQFDEMKESIGARLLPIITKLGDWLINKLVPAIGRAVKWVQDNWPKVTHAIVTAGHKIMGFLRPWINAVRAIWQRFGSTILSYAKSTWNNIRTVISGVIKVVRGIIQVVTGLIHGDWKRVWEGIKNIFKGVWSAIKGIVSQAINAVKTVLSIAWGVITAGIHKAWDAIISYFTSLPGRLASAAGDMFGFIRDAFRSVINWVIDKWNNFTLVLDVPDFLPGPDEYRVDTPNIPRLAKGGIVNSATLALIGEAGPEAVVPLNSRNHGLGGPVVNMYVTGSVVAERDLVTMVKDAIIGLRRKGYAI